MINRLFDHFDANKDGKIDKAEVKRKVEESRKKFQGRIEQHRGQRSGAGRGRSSRASSDDARKKFQERIEQYRRQQRSGGDRSRSRGSRSSADDSESKVAEPTKTA